MPDTLSPAEQSTRMALIRSKNYSERVVDVGTYRKAFVRRTGRRLTTAKLLLEQFEELVGSPDQFDDKVDALEDLWLNIAQQVDTVGRKLEALQEHKVISDGRFKRYLKWRYRNGQVLNFIRITRNSEVHDNIEVVDRLRANSSYVSTGLWVEFEQQRIALRPLTAKVKGVHKEFAVPTQHIDDQLESAAPEVMARLAIDWYARLVEIADEVMRSQEQG